MHSAAAAAAKHPKHLHTPVVTLCPLTNALQNGEWGRLFWSAFIHLDDAHIYYNMASFLSKVGEVEDLKELEESEVDVESVDPGRQLTLR